ncbi:MAG TPA: discoidin domain-containing protein [Thermoanaerobaculia bacterium]|nr:discoidin domain-containing protein [Thermoanaerobaculia bacterium]
MTLALLVLALAAPAKAPPLPDHRDDAPERENLLNYAHGAVAISRTGEATLKGSVLRAIDGDRDPGSIWTSPPHDAQQTLVFALPSRTRLTRIGAESGTAVGLRFEASLDGTTFRELASVKLQRNGEAQLFDVTPTEASYLRVTTLDTGKTFIGLNSVHARGTAIEPAHPGSLEGCWAMDTERAAMTQQGAYVFGRNGEVLLDGGSDGRFYRFVWTRGAQFGVAAVSVTPDGRHMSGIRWHEEAEPLFIATTWVGRKSPCTERPKISDAVFRAYLEKHGRYPMYGLRFDEQGKLLESESGVMLDRLAGMKSARIVANEFLQATAARNRAVAQTKLDTLRAALQKRGVDLDRFELVNHGSEQPHRAVQTDATRSLYGSVDLELRR